MAQQQENVQALSNPMTNISQAFKTMAVNIDSAKELIQHWAPPANNADRFDQAMLRLKGVKDDIAKVKTVQDRQGRSITDMRGHILAHTKELIRLDNNQLARMGNRNAVQGDGIIVALAGVGNAPIIGFPGTIEELDALDDPTIEALILALGIQVDVGAPMNLKKAIVRYYIGVPPA